MIIEKETPAACALYARVSKDGGYQDPETQLIKLREFASRQGYRIHKEYVDNASGGQQHRPALDQMIRDARGNRFRKIIAVRIDRLGRSVKNLLTTLEELDEMGVGLVCTDQEINTSTPMGKIIFIVIGAMAELELELIRDRTRDGLAKARAKGVRLGKPPNPATTADILRLKADGLSMQQIAEIVGMTRQGVRKRLRAARVTKRVEN